MRRSLFAPLAALLFAAAVTPAFAEEGSDLQQQNWSWSGVLGQYDKAQLRRGFQVYREVCSNCHSLKLVAYRNLAYLGSVGR